jgi:hypothetical protein
LNYVCWIINFIFAGDIINQFSTSLKISLLTYNFIKMKRIIVFLSAILITSITLFTSCTEDTTNPDLPPSISFVAGANYISADATVDISTNFTVKVLVEPNATSGKVVESLKVTGTFNNQLVRDTTFALNNATTMEITFTAASTIGEENLEFTAIDKDNQSAKISLKITTVEPAGNPILTWTEKIVGSWNNLTGSSFASINGNIYTLDQAFANQGLIDYMYWWGASTSATIGAPDDANAALVFNTGDYKLDNWTTKNPTRFKTTTVTVAAFDAMTDDTDIKDIAEGADQTRIGGLAVDQVIAFVTASGKKGLIKVKVITEGSDGSLTMDVKVQE